MKNNAHSKAGIKRQTFLYHNRLKLSNALVILAPFLFLSSCSLLPDKSSYDLDKQIERQQIQRELIAEPIEDESRTAEELEQLGDNYMSRGDINRAYVYYIKGLALEPDNVSLSHKQGILLLKKRKFTEADTVYNTLLTLNAKDSVALEGSGKAYFGQGKFTEAEQRFLAALEIDPELWQSHEFLGLLYSRQQEYDKAINRFKTALTYQPGNVSIRNNLALTYHQNGDLQEAVFLFKGLAKISTDRKIHNNLALTYFQLGLYQESLNSFKQGAENEAVAYNNMGYQFLTVKKYSQAIQSFEKAIALYPKFYPAAEKNLALANYGLSTSMTETGK